MGMLYLRWLRAEENNHSGQHRAAYDVLAWGLWQESGIRHAWLERQDRGKPFLPMHPQVHVNVTHCRFLAAAAVDAAPVGVDAEPVRPLRERVLERACAREEQDWALSQPDPDYAFIRLWTAKESYVKATGTGIGVPLQEITFTLTEESIRSRMDVGFTQLLLPEHVITICHKTGKGQVLTLCPKEEWICWNWI